MSGNLVISPLLLTGLFGGVISIGFDVMVWCFATN